MDLQGKSASPSLVALWKVCGLTREVDVAQCLSLDVPYVGFNFHKGSKRFITPAKAAEIWRQAVRGHGAKPLVTHPVAVVVDWPEGELRAALEVFPEVAVVQFHGKESPGELARLTRAVGERTIWKAFGIAKAGDLAHAADYLDSASLILFDSAVIPPGAGVSGGSGKTFDWNWLSTNPPGVPFGLAGGINPKNVRDALSYQPRLIDLCSGVEASPGVKNPALLEALAREMQRS
jgi:phosphoribosylanthranilate isomerase